MENVYQAIDEVISCIVESADYQNCLSYQEKMKDNPEITTLIQKVKDTQKKYVKSGYAPSILEELETYQKQLDEIPIYKMYQQSLDRVNEMISYVRESLNQYFSSLLNEKN